MGAGYSRYYLGDATREILTNNNYQGPYAWYNDSTYNIYSSNPWLMRGGYPSDGVKAGIFNFSNHTGWSAPNYTFRSVITTL